MKYYLTLAAIGFSVCALLSSIFLSTVSIAPWTAQEFELGGVCFCISGAFIASFPVILNDLLKRQRIWANPRFRFFGVPLAGASLGLLVLAWIAIIYPYGSLDLRTDEFQKFIAGAGPAKYWMQARNLVPKAEFLGICKILVEYGLQCAAASAALAMCAIRVYDTFSPRWTKFQLAIKSIDFRHPRNKQARF